MKKKKINKKNSTPIDSVFNNSNLEYSNIKIIQENILNWYNLNKRDLPFRKDKNPYKIWISEVMLQQTRVSAMLSSYYNFIKELPDILSLASSSEEKVISLWKGLGYYSRAKNLKKGAIFILENYEGVFPKELDLCLKIPGIGSYTANAILSIAFNLPFAVLDGNVKRVLSRLFLYEKNISANSSHIELQILANKLLYIENSGDHNQALMELGALICTPIPNCTTCPLINECDSYKNGKQNSLPILKKEENRIAIEVRFYLLKNKNNELLIYSDKHRRFFKTIPSLPFLIFGKNLYAKYEEPNEIRSNFLKSIQSKPRYLKKKHSITNHDITLSYIVETIENFSIFPKESIFIKLEELEENFPSSIARKLLKEIKEDSLF
jgi:A/G-specific adenine glycosylase